MRARRVSRSSLRGGAREQAAEAALHFRDDRPRRVDGIRRVVGYIPLSDPSQEVYINVGLSTRDAFASINQAARRGFMLIGAALILALSLSALLSRAFITRPFEIVTSGIQAWRRGDYQARISLPRKSGDLR